MLGMRPEKHAGLHVKCLLFSLLFDPTGICRQNVAKFSNIKGNGDPFNG
jgi:hypothetical protein